MKLYKLKKNKITKSYLRKVWTKQKNKKLNLKSKDHTKDQPRWLHKLSHKNTSNHYIKRKQRTWTKSEVGKINKIIWEKINFWTKNNFRSHICRKTQDL